MRRLDLRARLLSWMLALGVACGIFCPIGSSVRIPSRHSFMQSLAFALPSFSGTTVVAQEGGSALGGLIPLVLIFVAFYFFAIRPQQKRAKAQRELVNSIGVGDRIVTLGGIHGQVASLDEDTIRLEVAPGTTITLVRSAVGRRVVDATTGVDE